MRYAQPRFQSAAAKTEHCVCDSEQMVCALCLSSLVGNHLSGRAYSPYRKFTHGHLPYNHTFGDPEVP